MQLEAKMHEFGYFATLTYDDEFLPDCGSLVPADLSGFLKRLRANLDYRVPGARVRFSGCGEYGKQRKRPHYHVMLFLGDLALPDLFPWRESESGETLYRSKFVEDAWKKGFVELGGVTAGSCDYVAKYMLKQVRGDRVSEYLLRSDDVTGEVLKSSHAAGTPHSVLPEFTKHSTHPGIGASWFAKWHRDVVSIDGKAGIVLRGGERRSVPVYFLRMLKNNSQLRFDIEQHEAGMVGLEGAALKEARKRLVSMRARLVPGLEGLDGIEDIVKLSRSIDGRAFAVKELREVGGDRVLLAAMQVAERERISEYRAYLASQKKETL